MTEMKFPSRGQLETLCAWMSRGAEAMDSPKIEGVPGGRRRRQVSLTRLSGLTTRLGLPEEFHDMRFRAAPGSPLTVMLDPRLREELYRTCRLTGYVLRDGAGIPPLSATRMYIIHQLAWGGTYNGIADLLGVRRQTVSISVQRAREQSGVPTLGNLIGCAYRNGWLPDHEEILLSLSPTNSHAELLRTLVASPLGHAA